MSKPTCYWFRFGMTTWRKGLMYKIAGIHTHVSLLHIGSLPCGSPAVAGL